MRLTPKVISHRDQNGGKVIFDGTVQRVTSEYKAVHHLYRTINHLSPTPYQ